MMKKRKSKVLLIGVSLLLALSLTGCEFFGGNSSPAPSGTTSAQTPTPSGEGSDSADTAAVLNAGEYTTVYTYASEDTDTSWGGSAATIALNGSTAQISGSGASFSGSQLTIKQAGTYVISGTFTNGQIFIDAGKDDIVRLVLQDVTLHNETAPAIYAAQSEKVVLVLADGSKNSVSDGAGYQATGTDDPDAAIYAQDSLSVTGSGSLAVTGSYNHGIRAQDILAVTGGTLTVNAKGDALRGRDGVAVQNGSISLNAEGDGIQSNNDEDDKKGFVIIDGGTLDIQSAQDGIQAMSALTVTGGTLQIKTGGGSANAPTQEEDFRGGWGRGNETTATAEESVSMKALKAGKQLAVTGGDFTIDAEDDAVHSNNTVIISAGNFNIKTGDDGFHADAALSISGGKIELSICYEGIEGLSVTISGGDIYVTASDDAINAAGGVDNAASAGGPMGGDQFSSNGDIFIRISGGTLDLYALRDGLDANGDIFLEGGLAKISGPSQGMEGAIDLDGTMLVTGGELITAGSVLNVSSESTQPVLLVSYSAQIASGSTIEMKDEKGNVLLSYESQAACTLSGFTSPSFKQGETYSLFIGGEKRTDVKLNGNVTSIGDDGGTYNGGSGGGRGNWGGNGGMPGGGRPRR
ncbi:MAG: carbohydrate-binding domain-containing protein [Clostridium sp.]|jgi:hypothetical protein|nr:carbohydrate-binding domain-containing protein [Clostridium sp.]